LLTEQRRSGGGETAKRCSSSSFTHFVVIHPTPLHFHLAPVGRGKEKYFPALAMRFASELWQATRKKARPIPSLQMKGGGAPIGASNHGRAQRSTAAASAEAARLSAPHRGTRRAGRIRTSAQRSVPRFLRPGAFGRYPLPPVSVHRAPRRPVVVPVGRWPEAARERFARPPAGTALAPPSRSHPECALR
jgi:hypothetical protein